MVPKKGPQSFDEDGEQKGKVSINVDITCPNCTFTKILPKEKIPEGARWATCPSCQHRFEFGLTGPGFEFANGGEGSGTEDREGRGVAPWERRSELGIWQGLYQTSRTVLFSPEKIFGSMDVEGGIREPLSFGLLVGSLGAMFGLFWHFLLNSDGLSATGQGLIGQYGEPLAYLGLIALSPLFVAVIILVTSGILHASLLIVGGGKNGFGATLRVISYSQAAQVFGMVPFVGGVIGGLWALVVQLVGLREIHETSYVRVIFAFLVPLILIFLAVGAGLFFAIYVGSEFIGQIKI